MPNPIQLEDFDASLQDQEFLSSREVEAAKQAAYETGYKSGWDDCAAASEAEGAQLGADLSQSLRDLSFTYEEARQEVMTGVKFLLEGIAEQILPNLAAQAILPVLDAEIGTILSKMGGLKIALVAAPELCPNLRQLAERHIEADLEIHPDPAFGPGQVALKFAGQEQEIDLQAATDAIAIAIQEFLSHTDHSRAARTLQEGLAS